MLLFALLFQRGRLIRHMQKGQNLWAPIAAESQQFRLRTGLVGSGPSLALHC